jgi:hypothetical protein
VSVPPPIVARLDFTNAADALTRELGVWRVELLRDVERARVRGQLQLAGELTGLRQRVERVIALGQAIAGQGKP